MQKSSTKKQVWVKLLDSFEKSSKSASAWMKDNNISEGEFYYWKRKLKEETDQSRKSIKWQAVKLEEPIRNPEPSNQAAETITIDIAGAVITVRKGFDEAMLRAIVNAVRL
jgi:hypothetical protein